MITLTTPVKFVTQTDTTVGAVQSTIDLLNGTAQAVQTYGVTTGGQFVPDPAAPGVNITLNLVTGAVWANGVPLMSGGKIVLVSAADLAAIETVMTAAQKAFDQALIDVGIFAGTAS